MNTRRTMLLVAILLALGTGWLTLTYVSGLQREHQGDGAPRAVVIAARDIPARTTITAAMLRTETRPGSASEPDALSDPASATGALALITIPAGSQVTSSRIGRPSDLALPVRLRPGMRAVSIQIDKVKGVSGLVQPGDRVDVIAVPPRNGSETPRAAAILRGVRVLAIGSTLEYPSATPSPEEQNSTTVTLEVTPDQTNLIEMADLNATLRLALRSPKEPVGSLRPQRLVFSDGQSAGFVAPPALAPLAPVAAPAPRREPSSSVQVIVGDQILSGSPR